MGAKEEFISIYKENIKREGSKELLDYLQSSDFFYAPASSRFHSNFDGGLCEHSLNVYHRLKKLIDSEDEYYHKYNEETIAIIGLLHDLCKTNFYIKDYKKVNEGGVWVSRPFYKIDEVLPMGHGEKSVYLINKYMKLTDIEALAINWHMGPYDLRAQGNGIQTLENAYKIDPICFLVHIADSMATYIDEEKDNEDKF